ncbi:hypothetical protein E5676_scaffold45G00740 [Cucumis melo var. makuwa]|uniref:Ty3-gypsy retrotransposon protein n=1 Tax=Cucumis melo var. makuwa TaxID=1194695 RepID=A0A5D3CUA1_CUCMM|nr:hypothetical protein E5676_scaffold45G00740 [Cucumis melo var. makuwa]
MLSLRLVYPVAADRFYPQSSGPHLIFHRGAAVSHPRNATITPVVTLRFSGVTASVVGANSPLFGWIRLDVELNKDFSYSSGTVSFGITRLICVSFGITRLMCAFYGTTRLLCNGMARGRLARGKKGA